jgi:hypothetical protein
MTTTLPKNAYTKFCRFMYKGCSDLSCTFAHTEKELRNTIEEGTQDVRFVLPHSDVFPLSFVVQIESDDEESESDESEDENNIDIEEEKTAPKQAYIPASTYIPASLTLNQFCNAYQSEEWLDYYSLFLAERQATNQSQRIWNMVRDYAKVTATEGEQDMDLSM